MRVNLEFSHLMTWSESKNLTKCDQIYLGRNPTRDASDTISMVTLMLEKEKNRRSLKKITQSEQNKLLD